MTGNLTAILSKQSALAARARKQLGDVNEASLVVGRVLSDALRRQTSSISDDALNAKLREDLDALIATRRAN